MARNKLSDTYVHWFWGAANLGHPLSPANNNLGFYDDELLGHCLDPP